MLKTSLMALLLSCAAAAFGQGPAPADAAKTMEAACTGCHGPALIAQQRIDRNGWAREVDKMIRWGANVPGAGKEALITYLARTFNPSRSLPNSAKSVPAGKGADLFQTYCLSCHNEQPIASKKLDKTGWTAQVDQMIRWGAYVPSQRKDELIEYLISHWGL